MVSALAFGATAVATLFAQATLARATRRRSAHEGAWAFALFLFALASAALAIGVTTGWDVGTFRAFYLLGAILSVPWLALGTVYLLLGRTVGRRVQWCLVAFSGLAVGTMLSCSVTGPITGTTIPVGHEVLPVLPRDEEPQSTTQESMFSFVRLSDGGPPRHVGPRSEEIGRAHV